jgi:para-nitrobenzyl esterase
MNRLALALIAASAFLSGAHAATVGISNGRLAGTTENGIDIYKGIPYAAAPVGALRWEPPAPPTAWSGERDASKFGPICPQPARPDAQLAAGGGLPQSEDCLSLNVWTPHGAANAPVMVWIHGGAHRFGSGASPFYDGSRFARDGIVLVTINYRLGLLGYFAHPALTRAAAPDAPLGNYGQMDQIASLKWVQQNIAAFGGNPRNVTVFGESAGGSSILHLLATPSAKGLFARAIVESGGGWTQPSSLTQKEGEGVQFAEKEGLKDATVEQLRALPVDKTFDVGLQLGFGPFVDGRLIPELPSKALADGSAIDVPLIIGSNSFEASLMQSFKIPSAGILARLTPADRALYADAGDDEKIAHAVFTDSVMGAPAHWVAARAASGAPSFLYHFSYVPTLMRPRVEGARHGSEIPFVFETLDGIAARFGAAPSAQDATTETLVHSCWVGFAKTGAPSCGGWKAFSPASDTLMEFGETSGPVSHFRKAQYEALEARIGPR